MAKTKKSTKTANLKDYERLGRTMESIFEGGYMNHHRVYKINFVRGIFFGLGSVLGGTLVVAAILWILTLFGDLPLIGDLARQIKEAVQ